jgi:hypothetical protein
MSRRAEPRARLGLTVAALAALLLAAGCTGDGRAGAPPPAPRAAAPSSTPARPAAPAGVDPAKWLERRCDSGVYGDLGAGWRALGTVAGPLVFHLATASGPRVPAGAFQPADGGLLPRKLLVVVDWGSAVTVSVPPGERRDVSLSYDPAGWDEPAPDPGAGQQAVTFRACASRADEPFGTTQPYDTGTQFNGGLLVTGPRCVALDVRPDGRPPRRVVLSIGAGRCRG